MFCDICETWGVERRALFTGQYEDGKPLNLCRKHGLVWTSSPITVIASATDDSLYPCVNERERKRFYVVSREVRSLTQGASVPGREIEATIDAYAEEFSNSYAIKRQLSRLVRTPLSRPNF